MLGSQEIRLAVTASTDVEPDDAGEAALVAAAQADRRAFALLYRRHADPIYRYCYRRLGSKEAAEDATSLVFVKALEALPRYRSGTFRGWLFAIAHSVVADGYRSARPTHPLPATADLEDAAPGPEPRALATEEADWVRSLLARLPPDQRHLIELRLAGLSGAEIARALERSPGSVRTAQYRALARLRDLIGIETGSKEAERGDA